MTKQKTSVNAESEKENATETASETKSKYYNAKLATRYRKYRNEYVAQNTKQVLVRFNKLYEDDMLLYNYLTSQDNATQFIKSLIRAEMEKTK